MDRIWLKDLVEGRMPAELSVETHGLLCSVCRENTPSSRIDFTLIEFCSYRLQEYGWKAHRGHLINMRLLPPLPQTSLPLSSASQPASV